MLALKHVKCSHAVYYFCLVEVILTTELRCSQHQQLGELIDKLTLSSAVCTEVYTQSGYIRGNYNIGNIHCNVQLFIGYTWVSTTDSKTTTASVGSGKMFFTVSGIWLPVSFSFSLRLWYRRCGQCQTTFGTERSSNITGRWLSVGTRNRQTSSNHYSKRKYLTTNDHQYRKIITTKPI